MEKLCAGDYFSYTVKCNFPGMWHISHSNLTRKHNLCGTEVPELH